MELLRLKPSAMARLSRGTTDLELGGLLLEELVAALIVDWAIVVCKAAEVRMPHGDQIAGVGAPERIRARRDQRAVALSTDEPHDVGRERCTGAVARGSELRHQQEPTGAASCCAYVRAAATSATAAAEALGNGGSVNCRRRTARADAFGAPCSTPAEVQARGRAAVNRSAVPLPTALQDLVGPALLGVLRVTPIRTSRACARRPRSKLRGNVERVFVIEPCLLDSPRWLSAGTSPSQALSAGAHSKRCQSPPRSRCSANAVSVSAPLKQRSPVTVGHRCSSSARRESLARPFAGRQTIRCGQRAGNISSLAASPNR